MLFSHGSLVSFTFTVIGLMVSMADIIADKRKGSSNKKYKDARKTFKSWCKKKKKKFLNEEEAFRQFVIEYVKKKRSGSTIKVIFYALAARHEEKEQDSWTTKPIWKSILKGATRKGGMDKVVRGVKEKFPWTADRLNEFELYLRRHRQRIIGKQKVDQILDGCWIAFELLLRHKNVKYIQEKNITLLTNGCVELTVVDLKTQDQTSTPAVFRVPLALKSNFILRWRITQRGSCYIFPNWSEKLVNKEMKLMASKLNWSKDYIYCFHGLRIGGTRERDSKNEPIESIRALGTWKKGSMVFKNVYWRR